MRAPRSSDIARRRAYVLCEHSPQVTRTHAELRREVVFGGVVESTVGDAAHRATNELGRRDPTGLRDSIGPASQTGPKARRFSRRRVLERTEIAL
jgi:hypothetical protein